MAHRLLKTQHIRHHYFVPGPKGRRTNFPTPLSRPISRFTFAQLFTTRVSTAVAFFFISQPYARVEKDH